MTRPTAAATSSRTSRCPASASSSSPPARGRRASSSPAPPRQGIASGNQYKLDTYSIPKADSDQWGFDITTGGAHIAKFYNDPKPLPTNIIANETMPVAGVTLLKDGMTAAGAGYFNDTLTAVDGALTATGASGTAIVSSPLTGGGSFPTFSGIGPDSDADHLGGVARRLGAGPGPDHAFPPEL